MKSILSVCLISLIALLGGGCGVSVDRVTVQSGANPTQFPNPADDPAINLVNIEAQLSSGQATTLQGTPTASFARGASNNFTNLGSMSRINSTTYRLESAAIPDGPVHIQVQARYGVLFQAGNRTASKTVDFAIPLPNGCFFFDPDQAGWTASAFTGAPSGNSVCQGQIPILGADGPNIPPSLTQFGPFFSLRMPFVSFALCVQTFPPNSGITFVAADFRSPDLTGIPGWNTAIGYQLFAHAPGNVGANQPQLQLLVTNTQNEQFREGGLNNPVFHPLTSDPQKLTITRSDIGTFKSIQIRVLMPVPVPGPAEASINIDRVCPVQP